MNVLRRSAAITLGVLVSIPLVAAPVAAAVGFLPAWACAPGASGVAAADAGALASGRGGVLREPDLGQARVDLPRSAKGRAPAGFTATVDVYFHVVTNGSLGNLTNRQIASQISVLNTTFGGGEGGYSTGFSFQLAGVTRTNNAKWFGAKPGAEHEMKKTLKAGDDSDLNVYTTSGGGFLGWAYYPSITETNQAYLDGVLLNWATVPGASDAYEGRYDQGETLTHEVGHWLNLAHTFDGGCKDPGDIVEDTPPMSVPTGGCPAGKDSCPDRPGLDPIHNYMDYSYDSCYTEFTPGQTQRARDAWLLYRAS